MECARKKEYVCLSVYQRRLERCVATVHRNVFGKRKQGYCDTYDEPIAKWAKVGTECAICGWNTFTSLQTYICDGARRNGDKRHW